MAIVQPALKSDFSPKAFEMWRIVTNEWLWFFAEHPVIIAPEVG